MTFELSDAHLQNIIDNLDETGGFLIKESELKHIIEYHVNQQKNVMIKGLLYKIERLWDKTLVDTSLAALHDNIIEIIKNEN